VSEADGRRIQLVAWLVMLGSFGVFVAAVVGVPWLALRWWHGATHSEPAVVSCKTGSCALSVHGALPVARRMEDGDAEVPEGTTFATDGRSKGFVRLFDGSTVNLEPNTTVTLDTMRRPRFAAGTVQPEADLAVHTPDAGVTSRVSVGTTWDPTVVVVRTDHGSARIAPQSRVRIEVSSAGMRLVVMEGTSAVDGAGRSVAVDTDQMVTSTADAGPDAPRSALENVLADGDFSRPIAQSSWTMRVNLPGGGEHVERPTAEQKTLADGKTTVVHILRDANDGRPADLVLEESLDDRDVTWASQMGVHARLRVSGQSLPLGGTRGSEYPVILKLVGETDSGAEHWWQVGFWAVPAPADEPPDKYVANATDVELPLGVQVPLGEWFEFDSGNLLDPDSEYGFSRFDWPSAPTRLKRFEIIASGHDYSADVDVVQVWVK
jgi:hypothetical protein